MKVPPRAARSLVAGETQATSFPKRRAMVAGVTRAPSVATGLARCELSTYTQSPRNPRTARRGGTALFLVLQDRTLTKVTQQNRGHRGLTTTPQRRLPRAQARGVAERLRVTRTWFRVQAPSTSRELQCDPGQIHRPFLTWKEGRFQPGREISEFTLIGPMGVTWCSLSLC